MVNLELIFHLLNPITPTMTPITNPAIPPTNNPNPPIVNELLSTCVKLPKMKKSPMRIVIMIQNMK